MWLDHGIYAELAVFLDPAIKSHRRQFKASVIPAKAGIHPDTAGYME